MSAKENNSDVALDKVDGDKSKNDTKPETKGTKRPADVSIFFVILPVII